jgi:hypothetical protein
MPGPQGTPAPVGPPVAGYSLWLDATYTGNTASSWTDQSGYGRNATTGGTTPTLGTGIGGLQCYVWPNGSNSISLVTPSYPGSTAFSVFAVYQLSSSGLGGGRQGLIDATYSDQYILMTSWGNGSGSGDFGYVVASPFTLQGANLDTNAHVGSIVYPVTSISPEGILYWDGTDWGHAGGATGATSSRVRTIGMWPILMTGLRGSIGEVIEYPFALTPTQYTLVDRYLGTKWGVTVA